MNTQRNIAFVPHKGGIQCGGQSDSYDAGAAAALFILYEDTRPTPPARPRQIHCCIICRTEQAAKSLAACGRRNEYQHPLRALWP